MTDPQEHKGNQHKSNREGWTASHVVTGCIPRNMPLQESFRVLVDAWMSQVREGEGDYGDGTQGTGVEVGGGGGHHVGYRCGVVCAVSTERDSTSLPTLPTLNTKSSPMLQNSRFSFSLEAHDAGRSTDGRGGLPFFDKNETQTCGGSNQEKRGDFVTGSSPTTAAPCTTFRALIHLRGPEQSPVHACRS